MAVDYNLELIKSKFELARLLMMAAGFLIVASGIFWSTTLNFLSLAVNVAANVDSERGWINPGNAHDFLDPLAYGMVGAVKPAFISFFSAIVLSFVALMIWTYGDFRLRKLKKKNNKINHQLVT